MGSAGTEVQRELIAELCDQINSPLAAIRNALYLSATRSDDPALQHYLTLANAEISTIAAILRQARVLLGDVPCAPSEQPGNDGGQHHSRRAAA